MQTAEPPANRYDAMRVEINIRHALIVSARSAPAEHLEHLEQYSSGDVTGLAASKRVEGYRRNSGAMRTFNDSVSECAFRYLVCVWEVECRVCQA